MIGQKEVLKQIDNLIEKGFPRFIIITGQKGQGKTELANYIFHKLDEYYSTPEPDNRGGIYMLEIGIKIDEIREMIKMAYKQTEPIIYLIQNADKMSLAAKNSLLKVIEEPPQNAYFIMELQQIENTLSTIKSRCQEIKMEQYNEDEINEMMLKINPNLTDLEKTILEDIVKNYYQIQLFNNYGIEDFYIYCEKVVRNIYKVQSANSFKLAEKLDVKNDGNGYDLYLFFETIKNIYFNIMTELIDNDDEINDFINCHKSIEVTTKYQQKLNINGINKQSLIDMWILDIRKAWR